MGLHSRDQHQIPESTVQAAKSAFVKGNVYIALRDDLDEIYADEDFEALYPSERGRPAYSPKNLALCLIIQYAEGLSDRQMADAVRGRIELKYLLGLEIGDPGFDHSVLHNFRQRLLAGGMEVHLLDLFLEAAKNKGLVRAHGRQRTDATHVAAAVRRLNRLEFVGESMRYALNELADIAPEWLAALSPSSWYARYGARFEQHRLPQSLAERQALGHTIGQDGMQLLNACDAADAPEAVRQATAVAVLRAIWLQQYKTEEGKVQWREEEECPPGELLIKSPYDVEARYSHKHAADSDWVGYKVHVTEACDDDLPHLITNVETSQSTTPDMEMTAIIHAHLAEKGLLPQEHLLDAGYVSTRELVNSQAADIDLVGPVQSDSSWQAREGEGYDISCFAIDWERHCVTCPQGHTSVLWSASHARGHPAYHVRFDLATCQACPSHSQCSRALHHGRSLKLLPREYHIARQTRRQEQATATFKRRYARRAGVEGTISQAVRRCQLRRTRYVGRVRTSLAHILTAIALNFIRLGAWLQDLPRAKTRCSRFASLAAAYV